MPDLMMHQHRLQFVREVIRAHCVDPACKPVEKKIEVRTNPITRRTCRITLSRDDEKEAGTETLPPPPPDAFKSEDCPFCSHHVFSKTPQLRHGNFTHARLIIND